MRMFSPEDFGEPSLRVAVLGIADQALGDGIDHEIQQFQRNLPDDTGTRRVAAASMSGTSTLRCGIAPTAYSWWAI